MSWKAALEALRREIYHQQMVDDDALLVARIIELEDRLGLSHPPKPKPVLPIVTRGLRERKGRRGGIPRASGGGPLPRSPWSGAV